MRGLELFVFFRFFYFSHLPTVVGLLLMLLLPCVVVLIGLVDVCGNAGLDAEGFCVKFQLYFSLQFYCFYILFS